MHKALNAYRCFVAGRSHAAQSMLWPVWYLHTAPRRQQWKCVMSRGFVFTLYISFLNLMIDKNNSVLVSCSARTFHVAVKWFIVWTALWTLNLSEVSYCHGGEYEDDCPLSCCDRVVWCKFTDVSEVLTFSTISARKPVIPNEFFRGFPQYIQANETRPLFPHPYQFIIQCHLIRRKIVWDPENVVKQYKTSVWCWRPQTLLKWQ
jgi:hypothetical protein